MKVSRRFLPADRDRANTDVGLYQSCKELSVLMLILLMLAANVIVTTDNCYWSFDSCEVMFSITLHERFDQSRLSGLKSDVDISKLPYQRAMSRIDETSVTTFGGPTTAIIAGGGSSGVLSIKGT